MKYLALLILLSAAAILPAAEGRLLLRAGELQAGNISIKDGTCLVAGADGSHSNPLTDIVFAKFTAARIPTEIDQGLILTNGDLIAGRVTIGEDRRVTLVSEALGIRQIALEKVAVIVLHKQPLFSLMRNLQAEEGVLLLNGERLSGTIKWVTSSKLGIDAVFGLMEVDLENVAAVYYHPVKADPTENLFQLRLKSGDRFSGLISKLDDESIELKHILFETIQIQTGFIKELRPVKAGGEFLSMQKEEQTVTTPYFDTIRPPRKNKNYNGDALAIGNESYDYGLILMSRTSLTYGIKEGQTHLYTELGIDESVGKNGSVIIRIFLNDRELYKSPAPVLGTDAALPLLLALPEPGQLRIEIDFSRNGSVADFAVLGDAMLLGNGK